MMNEFKDFAVVVIVTIFLGIFMMWVSSLLHGSWPEGHESFLFLMVISLFVSHLKEHVR